MSKAAELAEFGSGISSGPNAVEGLGKYWVDFNGTGTVAVRDSLNHSSLTDGGTGIYTISYTNAFNNANYSIVGGQTDNAGSIAIPRQATDLATGSTVVRTTNGSSGADMLYVNVIALGDLA